MIVIVGLIIAFLMIVLFARRDMRGCRWRRVEGVQPDGQTPWRCAACGARVLTADGKPPLHCELERHL